jgi:rhodanese-related sulfurtransferase
VCTLANFPTTYQDGYSKFAKADAYLGPVISRAALTPAQHVARRTSRVTHHKVCHCRLHCRRCATHRHRRASVLAILQVYRASHMCRDDAPHQVMITGAINLPAQTFYPLLPTLTSILGRIPIVIFHCSSSLGRATRCAGWLQDALPPGTECKIFILEGGMKAWRARFGEDTKVIIEMPAEEGESTGIRK